MSAEESVHLTINERNITVPSGISVLQAARKKGVYIPTLCHLEGLSPSGACRLCIVEICNPSLNPEKKWIDSACVCPVAEGLTIQTDSPRVVRERKLILELLLSRAPGSEQIKTLAAEYGIEKSPFISVDKGQSNCILCGLCIRVCNEIIGANAIGTAQRGIRKEVISPYKIASSLCIGCLACVSVCPTKVIESDKRGLGSRSGDGFLFRLRESGGDKSSNGSGEGECRYKSKHSLALSRLQKKNKLFLYGGVRYVKDNCNGSYSRCTSDG